MKKTNLLFNFWRPGGSQGRPREDRVHPATESSDQSTNNDHGQSVITREPRSTMPPHWVAARSVLVQSPPAPRRSVNDDAVPLRAMKLARHEISPDEAGRFGESLEAGPPATSSLKSAGSSRGESLSGRSKSSIPPANKDKGRDVISEQPTSSTSSQWLTVRKVGFTSPTIDEMNEDISLPSSGTSTMKRAGQDDKSEPSSSKMSFATVANTCMKTGPKKEDGEDAIKVEKRRLAQRQRRLNPRRPLHPQHHHFPFIRHDIEAGETQSVENKKTRLICKAIRSCMCGIVSKCLITGEDIRNCVHDKWTAILRKKAEWDRWNPDRNHPLVQWINESKLAGLKETVKPNRSILYRIMWLMIFLILFGGGLKFSIDAYYFQKNSPILFGFKTKEIPIENIPFPTVTVCPVHSFKRDSIRNVERLFLNVLRDQGVIINKNGNETWDSEETAKLVYYMDHICSSSSAVTNMFKEKNSMNQGPLSHVPYSSYLGKHDIVDGNDEKLNRKFTRYLQNVSLKCEDSFRFCVWNLNKSENCENYFRSVLTNHGGCCSFNSLPLEKLHKQNPSLRSTWERDNPRPWKFADWERWSSDSFVLPSEFDDDGTFPARQKFGGRPWGLTFIHKMEDNGDCAQFDSSGSRITISIPGTDFDVAKLNIAIPPRSEVFIELTPELTTADEELKIIPPELRGCYFPDEKPLAYYNKYSQENCHRECFANFTLSECGCTLLSFPNSAGEIICEGEAIQCAKNAEGELFGNSENRRCKDCLPSCSQMTLRKEITATPLLQAYKSNSPFGPNDSSSIVHLYYGPSSVLAKERQLRHSKYELITHVGSIFETTNDISLIGTVKTVTSLYVFYPTTWELLKFFVLFLLKKCRGCLAIFFVNRQRIIVHNEPAPIRMVNVIEMEDEEMPNAPNVNYNSLPIPKSAIIIILPSPIPSECRSPVIFD